MKNYSELTDINQLLSIQIQLSPVGNPDIWVKVNHDYIGYNALSESITLDYRVNLLSSIDIIVELQNKKYNLDNETAIIIDRLSIDNIDIIPNHTHLADYTNDHNFNNPTNYLGFNGKWALTINCPFYQWLHQAQNQGWLIG